MSSSSSEEDISTTEKLATYLRENNNYLGGNSNYL